MKKIAFVSMLVLAAVGLMLFAAPIAHALGAAAPVAQTQEAPPAVGIVDVFFVLATIAFFKTQFEWTKWQVVAAAGVLSLLVGLGPLIQSALPFLTGWFDAVVGIFRLLMYAAGGYDLATDAGPKIFANLIKR